MDNTVSYCFTLFICGGPCHLSSFKQCSGDLTYIWEQLDYSVMENVCIITSLLLQILQS